MPAKEWEHLWARRGWKDARVIDVDDIPLIAEMPAAVRQQYDRGRLKLHAPNAASQLENVRPENPDINKQWYGRVFRE